MFSFGVDFLFAVMFFGLKGPVLFLVFSVVVGSSVMLKVSYVCFTVVVLFIV